MQTLVLPSRLEEGREEKKGRRVTMAAYRWYRSLGADADVDGRVSVWSGKYGDFWQRRFRRAATQRSAEADPYRTQPVKRAHCIPD